MGNTPDFEDWLARQDETIGMEETIEIETYQEYIANKLGKPVTPAMSDVIEAHWYEEYNILLPLGIKSVTYTYETGPREGQRETRWVIAGSPGLWGRDTMLAYLEEMKEVLP